VIHILTHMDEKREKTQRRVYSLPPEITFELKNGYWAQVNLDGSYIVADEDHRQIEKGSKKGLPIKELDDEIPF